MAFHSRSASRQSRRPTRLGATLAIVLGLVLGFAGCGFEVQTLQPYTAADGVSTEVGGVKVRNLMILSKSEGSGFLSGSLYAPQADSLTAVSGTPLKADGTDGQPLTISLGGPVTLDAGQLTVLTDEAAITVQSADLQPGLEAKLELTFSKAGTLTITVPVVDANQPGYSTVSPGASSASPSS